MRRTIVTLLVLGLVAGSLVAPVEAKKKKKKPPAPIPVELKYFTHWDDDGAGGCTGQVHMNLQDTKGDTTCSTTTQVAQEILAATGQDLVFYEYPATEGLPFILDASRKITGEATIRGTFTVQAYVEIELRGTIAGEEKIIATGTTGKGDGLLSNSAQGVDLPGPAPTLPFEIEIDPALDQPEVTALVLKLTVRGVHRGHIDHERNPTFLIIPAFQ